MDIIIAQKFDNSKLINVGIHPTYYTSKPTDYGKIKNEMVFSNGTISELAHDVVLPVSEGKSIYGARSFSPGVLNGGSKAEHWISQQVFAIDIDNKNEVEPYTYKQFREQCEKYNIMPTFVYSTFSDDSSIPDECIKFRPVWVLPYEITSNQVRYALIKMLMKPFRGVDLGCTNADRVFNGGKALLYFDNTQRLDIDNLVYAVVDVISLADKKNAARNIQRFCKDVGLAVINNTPAVLQSNEYNMEDLDTCTLYTKVDVTVSSKIDNTFVSSDSADSFKVSTPVLEGNYTWYFSTPKKYNTIEGTYTYSEGEKVTFKYDTLRSIDYDALYKRCPVYRDFMDGKDIHENVTRMVMSNLQHMEYGESKFFEGLQKREEYDLDRWARKWKYHKDHAYQPTRYSTIKEWYPDAQETAQAINIVSAAKVEKGTINVYEPVKYISMAEAEKKRDEIVNYAKSAEDTKVHLLHLPTSLGKSESFLDAENIIYAVPTHKLKHELYNRMIAKGNTHVVITPELPTDLDPTIADYINRLYSKGAISAASKEIRNLATKIPELQVFIDEMDAVYHSKGATIITTHARLLYLPQEVINRANYILIDEDITKVLYPSAKISQDELLNVLSAGLYGGFGYVPTAEARTLISLRDTILEAKPHLLYEMPSYFGLESARKQYEKAVINSNTSSNLFSFLDCTFYVKEIVNIGKRNERTEIHYIQRKVNRLPLHKKIIILSATASDLIYRRTFGERLVKHSIGHVEPMGKVIQDVEFSNTRTSLANTPEALPKAQKVAKGKNVITFKSFGDAFENVVATYGATEGLNHLAGNDLVVIGTPYHGETDYLLLAKVLGIHTDGATLSRSYVKRNGMEFRFTTYHTNQELQTLQLDLIESELVQAVGRARILRYPCTVEVYSNYPLPGATFI